MTRTCIVERPGLRTEASWSLDIGANDAAGATATGADGAIAGREEASLIIRPAGGPPEIYRLADVAGIAGDEYSVQLTIPAVTGDYFVVLSRLGRDGPDLLADLWRIWPPARATHLRLAGRTEPTRFSGVVRTAGLERAACLLVYEDRLLIAPAAGDVEPIFASLLDSVVFDPVTYQVTCITWDGCRLELGKLAGQTEECVDAMQQCLLAAAQCSEEALQELLPHLGAAERVGLAAAWPAGRPVSLARLTNVCAEFPAQLRACLEGWPRAGEGAHLIDSTSADSCYLFVTPAEFVSVDGTEGTTSPSAERVWSLWLLARYGTDAARWVLECLTHADIATYVYADNPGLLDSLAHVASAPHFIGEALFLTAEELPARRPDLAAACRHVPFLVQARAAFRKRVIHHPDTAVWKQRL